MISNDRGIKIRWNDENDDNVNNNEDPIKVIKYIYKWRVNFILFYFLLNRIKIITHLYICIWLYNNIIYKSNLFTRREETSCWVFTTKRRWRGKEEKKNHTKCFDNIIIMQV